MEIGRYGSIKSNVVKMLWITKSCMESKAL